MTQQIPPPPLGLRKGLLIIGITLLILSFLFFYGASKINWEYTRSYQSTVNLTQGAVKPFDFGNGTQNYNIGFAVTPYNIELHTGDLLVASYDPSIHTNGTVYLFLWQEITGSKVLAYSGNQSLLNELDYYAGTDISAEPYIASVNSTNVVPVTTVVHHYEPPEWFLFGAGLVLSSLALIPVYKSGKQA